MKRQRSCEVLIRIILIIRVRKFVTSSGWVPGIQERTINQAIFKRLHLHLPVDSGMFEKQSHNLIYQYIVVLYDKYISRRTNY
ncbi:uncharacterized protein LOC117153716 isoform X6 [Bombus vancouverensis nearcticus]|uniref:uncharacterized protein LOC117153716 isoform X6 n=1 Tax=Bombus vancouverensis nearcticus TaxID=2705178 RepID=UPI00402BAFEE